jgi:hypothetical protein
MDAAPAAAATHRLGLIADTHGWLDPALAEHFRGVAMILHAGDVGRASVLEGLRQIAPVVAVRGNVDGGELARLPLEAVVEAAGKRIALLHIAGSPRWPEKAALELLRRERPDVLVVGHSHIAAVGRVEGALWINPGAAGHEGFHERRLAGILEIGTGELQLYRIDLGPRGRRQGA